MFLKELLLVTYLVAIVNFSTNGLPMEWKLPYTTVVTKKNLAKISEKVTNLPKKLNVGRCNPKNTTLLHSENIILKNEYNNSDVLGTITTTIDGPIEIKCAIVVNNAPDEEETGNPFYLDGGPNRNVFSFGIWSKYGFNITLDIYGIELKQKNDNNY